jgi:nucleoporin POM152
MDVAKLPSVRPSDSLTLAPQKLSSSESVLFLSIDKPSVVKLKSAVDSGKNGFHITPHKEAVVIECPTGGHFVEENNGQLVQRPSKAQPAELRCMGSEETVKFQARGVGPLRATWRKTGPKGDDQGVIEGIEDLTYKDRVSRTYTVPLRVSHDLPGVHKIALTGVHDSMHNSYTPSGYAAEKTFNVIPRPVAQFGCSSPKEILVGKSISLPISLDGLGSEATELIWSFTPADGQGWNKTQKILKRSESITVDQSGVYSLVEVKGPCGGTVMEPSSCVVQLVPPPSLDMQVRTLHEW